MKPWTTSLKMFNLKNLTNLTKYKMQSIPIEFHSKDENLDSKMIIVAEKVELLLAKRLNVDNS